MKQTTFSDKIYFRRWISRIGTAALWAAFLFGVFRPQMSFSDVIHLKNGDSLEGWVRESDQGYWIDGVLFSKEEVSGIEEKELPPEYSGQKGWFKELLSRLGFEDPDEVKKKEALEAYYQRMGKNRKVLDRWMLEKDGKPVPEEESIDEEKLESMTLNDKLKLIKEYYKQGGDFDGNPAGGMTTIKSDEEYIEYLQNRNKELETIDKKAMEIVDKVYGGEGSEK